MTIRIATISAQEPIEELRPCHMAHLRWLRMSEALTRLGYMVDIVMNGPKRTTILGDGLRVIPMASARWEDYDVIKSSYHRGALTIKNLGLEKHPCIISRLGAVLKRRDETEDGHFVGPERSNLWQLQPSIDECSRWISVLTREEKQAWEQLFGPRGNILVVPTGVDRYVPPPGPNPYAGLTERIVVYIGNMRGLSRCYELDNGEQIKIMTQEQVNRSWQHRLNELGKLLQKRGIRLCVIGPGNVDMIDKNAVSVIGPIENSRLWDYHYYARAGIALAQGPLQHNECSKIYQYLRAGLPVISESPIPNNALLSATRHGYIVPYGDRAAMVDAIEQAVNTEWDHRNAMDHMIRHHTWDARALVYDSVLTGRPEN